MWPMAASAAASHRSLRTVRPETAWKVVGVTNSRAPAPHEVRTLVGGDAARDAKKNAFALHGKPGSPPGQLSHRACRNAQTSARIVGNCTTSGAFSPSRPGEAAP